MPDSYRPDPRSPRRVIHLCPERVPRFGRQSKSDQTLSETMILLNRELMKGPRRARETQEQALKRVGFVLRDFER